MNEAQDKLLHEQSVVVLPETISHDTYQDVLQATLLYPDKTLTLYCRGDGGDTRAALAMVDLIQHHGKVVGMLPGEANSSHVAVWAACAARYVYPHAAIGLHKVAWNGVERPLDSRYAGLIAKEFEGTERKFAQLLAAISNQGADYWLDLINRTGSGGLHQIEAAEIIAMGMALPLPPKPHPLAGLVSMAQYS